MPIKFLSHTADVKFQATGKNLEQAFEQSAIALQQTIAPELKIKSKIKKQIKIEGHDLGSLLYNFLEEFIYKLDAEDFLFSEMKKIEIIKNKKFTLNAEISGDKASNYKISNPVKAITYNDMFIKKQGKNFVCQVVLDV